MSHFFVNRCNYGENTMRINDEDYFNKDYIFMCFETISNSEKLLDKKITYIPLSVKDNEYIKFLEIYKIRQ